MEFIISKELAEKILQYLATKPFGEVYQLVGELQKITPMNEATNEVEKDVNNNQ